jgi:hypothetical protein
MKRREGLTATGRSRFVPRCARHWMSIGCVLLAAGCLNPWPDDYPSESGAATVTGGPPAFGEMGGGSVSSPSGGYDDFVDGDPADEPAINPPQTGPNESPQDADAGAPEPDGGLKATTLSTSRALQDAGADAR